YRVAPTDRQYVPFCDVKCKLIILRLHYSHNKSKCVSGKSGTKLRQSKTNLNPKDCGEAKSDARRPKLNKLPTTNIRVQLNSKFDTLIASESSIECSLTLCALGCFCVVVFTLTRLNNSVS